MIKIGYNYNMYLINPYIYGAETPSYLLDTYSAAAAYSLRQLKTGVTNVVRVRRSSDNAEQDFTATEITDGTLTTFTGANDGFVVTWYDQSGNGNNATQSGATAQPKIVSSGSVVTTAGGNYGVDFDGSNDWLPLTSSISTTQLFYSTSVFERLTSGIRSVPFGRVAGSNNTPFWWNPANGIYSNMTTQNLHDSSQTQTGEFLQTSLRDSSNNLKYWLNASAGTIKTYANGTGQLDSIGSMTTLYHNGITCELIYFNDDQEANRGNIELDINTYYSIY